MDLTKPYSKTLTIEQFNKLIPILQQFKCSIESVEGVFKDDSKAGYQFDYEGDGYEAEYGPNRGQQVAYWSLSFKVNIDNDGGLEDYLGTHMNDELTMSQLEVLINAVEQITKE